MQTDDDWGDAPGTPTITERDIMECRRLVRLRRALTPGETARLDELMGPCQDAVEEQFYGIISEARQYIMAGIEKLDLTAGAASLQAINPHVVDCDSPDAYKRQIVTSDTAEGVCFDMARAARRYYELAQDQIRVWKSTWIELAISPSNEQAEGAFCRMLQKELFKVAKLGVWLDYYDTTMGRVRSVYEKLSRMLTADTSWPTSPNSYV